MLKIVIVCFNSGPILRNCLASLCSESLPEGSNIVVVNNSQSDGDEIAGIAGEFGGMFVQNPENLGYGHGCNVGARAGHLPPYVLFLNPDVSITPSAIRQMIAAAQSDPAIVALGPLQRSSTGKVRGKRRAVGQGAEHGAPLRVAGAGGALIPTGFISGGAMMVRYDTFEKIGGFDERIFLFHEDDDLCLRLAKHGRLVYASDITVTHHHGTSTARTEALTRLRAWHLGFSRIYVLRKHNGRRAAWGALLHALYKFFSPEILTRHGRIKALAFLAGTRNALGQDETAGRKINRPSPPEASAR